MLKNINYYNMDRKKVKYKHRKKNDKQKKKKKIHINRGLKHYNPIHRNKRNTR